MVIQETSLRQQKWGDDLRLPTVMEAADINTLLTAVTDYKKPSVPFQSKHLPALKRNIWYALRRPNDRSRTGLLCILPTHKCCVYVSGDSVSAKYPTPRIALLRLRIDPEFIAPGMGATIFSATLSPVSRRIWIEDTLVWKGRDVFMNETFSDRWRLAAQWLEHYCIQDNRLLGGIELEMANWAAIADVAPEGAWELQSDEAGRRRLLWIANREPATPPMKPTPPPEALPAIPSLEISSLVACASRASGPDQWNLTSADGVSLGRALIRTMTISSALRTATEDTVRLEVEWNPTFAKWEARAISSDPVSHSSFFDKSK